MLHFAALHSYLVFILLSFLLSRTEEQNATELSGSKWNKQAGLNRIGWRRAKWGEKIQLSGARAEWSAKVETG
jgi:hypothetical protein